ncbi:MAG: hypothetical protein V1799_11040 [bacterium]
MSIAQMKEKHILLHKLQLRTSLLNTFTTGELLQGAPTDSLIATEYSTDDMIAKQIPKFIYGL